MPSQSRSKLVDAYIAKQGEWQRNICIGLRNIIHKADPAIKEEIKWGSPAYLHNGLICGTWAFKGWVSLTFFQGALIKDKYKLFNYGEKNDRNRTVKIANGGKINEKAIIDYVQQAVANHSAGQKTVNKPEPKTIIILPAKIKKALLSAHLLPAYNSRPYYQRKDYILWITHAKQKETQERRIQKLLQELKEGSYMPSKSAKGRRKKLSNAFVWK